MHAVAAGGISRTENVQSFLVASDHCSLTVASAVCSICTPATTRRCLNILCPASGVAYASVSVRLPVLGLGYPHPAPPPPPRESVHTEGEEGVGDA